MDRKNIILKQLTLIFQKELEDENLQLNLESSPKSVERWDSLNNLVLITAIEKEFKLEFSIDAIFELNNVGDIVEYLYKNSSV